MCPVCLCLCEKATQGYGAPYHNQGVKVFFFTAPEPNRIRIRKPQAIPWLHETRKHIQEQSLRHAEIKGIDEVSIARPITRLTGKP